MTTTDDLDSTSKDSFPIVGVGASAGGLEAFTQLLRHLPGDTGLACVLVQHLHPTHASHLVDLLARISAMSVVEAQDGSRVARNRVYVIPPNTLLRIEQGILRLGVRVEGRGLQMPIDHFFTALADDRGTQAIGVVLSGMGSDGTLGLKTIKAGGGITFAQDQSALHQSMPSSAIASGCIDYVLSPDDIARELIRISQHPYVNGGQPPTTPAPSDAAEPVEVLGTLFRLLRQATRIDYANYKRSTVQRRIQRRLMLHKLQRLEDYVAFVRDNPAEIQALHEDILIHVTSFFRDPETFAALGRTVFPRLLQDRPPELPVRLWVPGCSTGEEVYSLAICLLESLGDRAASTPIKIFATDVNESALDKARSGRYLENSLTDLSPERMRRFFLRDDSGFQIVKSVRELCIFARHDATHDPPFSSIDLISCRNVLIYLGTVLQKRVLPLFHYSLRDGGYLLLGASETIGALSDLFDVVDPQCRIYARKATPQRLAPDFALGAVWRPEIGAQAHGLREAAGALDIQREADRVVFSRYAPPGVVVNDDLEVLQFRGHNDHVLAHPPGIASLNLLRLAREGLLLDLRAALDEARKTNAAVSRENVRVAGPKGLVHVHVRVTPISVAQQRCFVVVFEENAAPRSEPSPSPPRVESAEADAQVLLLQQELSASRDYLQAIIEEQEATNEELRAANEEIVSSNEELQSTNEELQTAKEELQAANEELSTVNEELQWHNRESTQLSDDLTNLIRSTNIPIVMVGQDLRIRRFSPSATEILSLLASDVGRPLADIRCRLVGVALEQCAAEVIDTLATQERDVQDDRGRWFHLFVRPYRTQDNKIDGAVIAAVDVDEVKNGELRLRTILEEKDLLLREVHHRVKNNLALVASLLNMQAGEVADGPAVEVLRDSQNRIHALALVHEFLQQSGDVVAIDFADYVRKLATNFLGASGAEPHRLRLRVEGAPVMLSLDEAMPSGLILAELLSNCLKHAFPDGRSGEISVELQPTALGVRLVVKDDGVGFPADRDPQQESSLGLTIVRRLSEQLGGTFTVTRLTPGTACVVEFRNKSARGEGATS